MQLNVIENGFMGNLFRSVELVQPFALKDFVCIFHQHGKINHFYLIERNIFPLYLVVSALLQFFGSSRLMAMDTFSFYTAPYGN